MDYISLKNFVNNLNSKYVSTRVIGKSALGKNLYGVFFMFNDSNNWAVVTAGIHAREHLSTELVVKQITDLVDYVNSVKTLPDFNICFVPTVNPDGADIVIKGIKYLSADLQQKLININKSTNFTLYKANANGVDLNNNFNANWNNKFTKTHEPSSQGFYGYVPESESEVQALKNLTLNLNPFITISYHLKGEEIYFDFFQNAKEYLRDKQMAEVFASSTGYTIKPTQHISSGGYKDWCVTLGIPALTIELGEDKFSHPYPASQIKNIYNKNKDLLNCLIKCYNIYNSYKDR